MKINEVINESVYDWFSQRTAARKGAVAQQDATDDAYGKAVANIGPKIPAPVATQEPTLSPHLQQFSISSENPLRIFYKKNEYEMNPTTGAWVTYPSGKPIPEPLTRSLNQYMAAITPEKQPPPTTKPPLGKKIAITVKDKQGVLWTKDEDNNRWVNDSGQVVTDPTSIQKLEKAAQVQYQSRMLTHRL